MKTTTCDNLVSKYKFAEPIYVSRPNMSNMEDFCRQIEHIWESKQLTNEGPFHKEFERRLTDYLNVDHINLFCNGTIALLVALHSLRINSGEVITTPFTFPATVHVLFWNRIKPVFCDIDEKSFNLNPDLIEHYISPETRAILPVHVYGYPCDVEAIQSIADRHGLHVIYDAAHTFGAQYKGKPLAGYGDISMLSFHATKLFSTMEGGALVVGSEELRKRINFLKNFGIADEETVIGPGINGKMNELQAAYGLLQLEIIDEEIGRRHIITQAYRRALKKIPGITIKDDFPGVKHNYGYLPILVNPDSFGTARDELYLLLKKFNVHTRKYFHPLCSSYSCYSSLPSARSENLPVSEKVAGQVLCLPLYGGLEEASVERICEIIKVIHQSV